jgi:O-antigen/teichoic acid export membrane protein
MCILVWAEIILFLHLINACVLVATDSQRLLAAMIGLSAVTNVVLNCLLVPTYQAQGAAVATLVSYGLLPLQVAVFKSTRWLFRLMVRSSLRLVVPGIAAYGVGRWLLGLFGGKTIWPTAISCLVFGVGCLVQRTLLSRLNAGVDALRSDDSPESVPEDEAPEGTAE